MENHIEVQEQHDKGFTLVELLIVIVILGILATVTVFAVRGITDQGKAATCKSDSKTLQTAYEAYCAQYGGTTVPATTAVAAVPASAFGPADIAYAANAVVPAGAPASYAANGATAEQTLVNAGFVRSVSSNWVMSPGGVLSVELVGGASANGCTLAMV